MLYLRAIVMHEADPAQWHRYHYFVWGVLPRKVVRWYAMRTQFGGTIPTWHASSIAESSSLLPVAPSEFNMPKRL